MLPINITTIRGDFSITIMKILALNKRKSKFLHVCQIKKPTCPGKTDGLAWIPLNHHLLIGCFQCLSWDGPPLINQPMGKGYPC